MIEYIFIINLFGDINVANILYKPSQTYESHNDSFYGTE
jgi:hypothetical protein